MNEMISVTLCSMASFHLLNSQDVFCSFESKSTDPNSFVTLFVLVSQAFLVLTKSLMLLSLEPILLCHGFQEKRRNDQYNPLATYMEEVETY